jgi:hypothetical protein
MRRDAVQRRLKPALAECIARLLDATIWLARGEPLTWNPHRQSASGSGGPQG